MPIYADIYSVRSTHAIIDETPCFKFRRFNFHRDFETWHELAR